LKFVDVLLQSLAIGVVVALSSVAVSVFLIWRGSRDERIRRITAAILSLPLSISRSSLALGIMLCYGFGLLMLYGSWTIIVIGQIAIIVPLTARVIEASWTRIGVDVRQAAELFGASRIFTLLKVELPLIAPAVLASFLLAFSSSISEFTMANFFSTFNLVTLPVSVVSLIDLRRMDLAAALNGIIIVIVIAAEVMSSFLSDEALRVI
jgi:ABC-type Fe3+ transport system permease subunit